MELGLWMVGSCPFVPLWALQGAKKERAIGGGSAGAGDTADKDGVLG